MKETPGAVRLCVRGYPASIRIFRSRHLSAPTILALHGFSGSGEDFGPLREAIGAGTAHWICPDFMGHGDSASPPVLDAYALPAVLALIDKARRLAPDPDKVTLLGYSMGGRIALHYLRFAKRLPSVLIGASPGLADPVERRERREMDVKWIEMLQSPDPIDEFCAAWEAQPLIEPQTRLPEPLRTTVAERRRANNPQGLAHCLMACGTGSLPDLWKALPTLPPLTLVHGELDNKFAAVARAMAGANPEFKVVEVPACGHAPHLENPSGCGIPLYP
jgi:2-succinyl-6-hydroxy-2,4-cyclohexadiene-1-carboxylate synthase